MSRFDVEAIIDFAKFERLIEDALNSKAKFLPKCVLTSKQRHSKYAFLVHWSNSTVAERTWETEESIGSSQQMLLDFKRAKKLPLEHQKIYKSYALDVYQRLVKAAKLFKPVDVENAAEIVSVASGIQSNHRVELRFSNSAIETSSQEDFEVEAPRREHIEVVNEDMSNNIAPTEAPMKPGEAKRGEKPAIAREDSNISSVTVNADHLCETPPPTFKVKRLDPFNIFYKGKSFTIPPLFRTEWNGSNEDRTLLNDTVIEFYLCHFLWDKLYDDNTRSRFHVFNTFFYDKLQTRLRYHFRDVQPRQSELGTHYNNLFQRGKPGTLLRKEVLVIPCHIRKPKHWFLILVHNPSGAVIRRRASNEVDDNNNRKQKSLSAQIAEYAQFEEGSECRIIIMDSLCHSRRFGPDLAKAHEEAFDSIRVWLQMAAAANGEELRACRVKKIVCQNLPRQKNGVDCGIFMMAFAEYFTWFNTEWLRAPTDSLVNMRMDDDLKHLLDSVEPRMRLEAILQKFTTSKRENSTLPPSQNM
ncbi:hypothetical protein L3Y34_015896 [Caenorhabditis briggsae]|uniref:Ubiquitin-like protease family profile domain-containing protein n=1 Tax=Caenorhabditis briggsae TaxID=6238 RepID=A0AAE9J0D7_CAEBR|nr:hypothetical protein L3Y34_015896 [Caenorhabditis briggsae]